MHTCPPPIPILVQWLNGNEIRSDVYGHLLLEQQADGNDQIIDGLRPYFESAHRDAREIFHDAIGIDIHPDATGPGAHAQYPRSLPPVALRGLFGEVLAGLIAQSYTLVGQHRWSVPIFLFRYHADVEAYMFDLARDLARARQVFGRFGNDFIGIEIDPQGAVVAFIAGEAKWRQSVTPGEVATLMLGEWTGPEDNRVRNGRGIWYELNRGLSVPRGLKQLQQLLIEKEPDAFAAAILSLDRSLLVRNPVPLEKVDYVVVAGDRPARRAAGETLLPRTGPPPEYTAGRKLQIVEVVLTDGGALIDNLYQSLWGDPVAAV